MKLSKFVHIFDINESIIALYHSLTIECVFFSNGELDKILKDEKSNEFKYLKEHYFIVSCDYDDIFLYNKSLLLLNKPSLANVYVLTSENCNFACKYCFLSKLTHENNVSRNMTTKVADEMIDMLSRQYKKDSSDYEKFISFFGGEPLLNFSIIRYIVDKIELLSQEGKFPSNIKWGVITNGSLLNMEIINYCMLHKIAIGISYDIIEEASKERINKLGNSTFYETLDKINMCKEMNVEFSLSVTVTEKILDNQEKVIDEIINLSPSSVSLNMLIIPDKSEFNSIYYERYASFLIYAYTRLREVGIYEDRIMRKVKSFTKQRLYYYDCCATGGNQLVVRHNGKVGVCHAFMNSDKFFNASVFDKEFSLLKNKDTISWSQRTPLKMDACIKCECLGICGGGCAYIADKMSGTINGLDEGFCIVTKKILKWLICDLFDSINKNK